tara:strand:- start:46 stop:594 length:549 start_codon:yes stop_codon:yes gene_type:complete
MKKRLLIISGLLLLAAISRMIPHPYNFAPIGAMSLFGAAYFSNKKLAFALPLLAFFISDLLVNNILYAEYYTGFVLISPGFYWTYGAMIAIVFAGILILKKVNFKRVVGGALSASVIFFIISNFGVWLTSPMYDLSIQGFIACYAMAIPFFHMTVLGDLFYSGVLFGAYEFAKYKVPELRTA